MTHAAHEMHDNSLEAYQQEAQHLDKRKKMILAIFKAAGRPLTARDVLDLIDKDQDMNYVAPRISELKKAKLIMELANETKPDRKSGKPRSLFVYVPKTKQLAFL